MTCRFVASDQPRMLTGRHADHCQSDQCAGCQPCLEPHCRICNHTHADHTCAECLAITREALRNIGTMCHALPAEVKHRGIKSEAMTLLGPVADVEARGYVEASYASGRLPEGWIDAAHGKGCPLLTNDACTGCAGGETHPLTVLGTWLMVWVAELDHDAEPGELADMIDYLDVQMTYMATWPHAPFEDFARDVRRCEQHLLNVLHDMPRGDIAEAKCFTCHGTLERELTRHGMADVWTCQRCRRAYTDPEYHLALRALLEGEANAGSDG